MEYSEMTEEQKMYWDLLVGINKDDGEPIYTMNKTWPIYVSITKGDKAIYDGRSGSTVYLTPKMFYEIYKSYIAWWNHQFAGRETKYIPTKDKIKSVGKFLSDESWKKGYYNINQFLPEKYLFNGAHIEQVVEDFNNAASKIKNAVIKKEKKILPQDIMMGMNDIPSNDEPPF